MKIKNFLLICFALLVLFSSVSANPFTYAFDISNKAQTQAYGLGNTQVTKEVNISEQLYINGNGQISDKIINNLGIPRKHIKNFGTLITVPLFGKDYVLYSINGEALASDSCTGCNPKILKVGLLDTEKATKYEKGNKITGLSIRLTSNTTIKTPVTIEVADFLYNTTPQSDTSIYPSYSVKLIIKDLKGKTIANKTVRAGSFEYLGVDPFTIYVDKIEMYLYQPNSTMHNYAMIIPDASNKQIFLENGKEFMMPSANTWSIKKWLVSFGQLEFSSELDSNVIKSITLTK